jgi:hypothetical protein
METLARVRRENGRTYQATHRSPAAFRQLAAARRHARIGDVRVRHLRPSGFDFRIDRHVWHAVRRRPAGLVAVAMACRVVIYGAPILHSDARTRELEYIYRVAERAATLQRGL